MKLNIIFDGNFLLHKTKSIFLTYGKYPSLTEALSTKELRAEFLRKVIIDFCFTTNQILNNSINIELNSIVVVFDKDESFRKTIYLDYKKKKEDDGTEEEGKKHFYNVMETFKKLLDKRGIITSAVSGLEGDDLCHIWSKGFTQFSLQPSNQKPIKNIIITADRDIVQSVDENTVVFNNNSKMLKMYSITGKKQDMLNKKQDVQHIKVDPKEFLFKKILIGDQGDNIPNIVKGMGEKKVDSIASFVSDVDLMQCDFHEDEYVSKIAIVCNTHFGNKKDDVLLVNNIKRNAKLIQINTRNIPLDLLSQAKTEFKEKRKSFSFKGELNLSNILKQE